MFVVAWFLKNKQTNKKLLLSFFKVHGKYCTILWIEDLIPVFSCPAFILLKCPISSGWAVVFLHFRSTNIRTGNVHQRMNAVGFLLTSQHFINMCAALSIFISLLPKLLVFSFEKPKLESKQIVISVTTGWIHYRFHICLHI